MKTKVKICGIRDLKSAQVAIDAGADFLGFNFIPISKRYIDPKKAKEIMNQLRINNYQLRNKIVGVFQNQPTDEVNAIAESVGLDIVQLHGEEDEEYMNKINTNIIKKIVISLCRGGFYTHPNKDNSKGYPYGDKLEYLILDRENQGEGQMVDLQIAKEIAKTFPIFFAGGLTPENVTYVVSKVQPFAVDVAGGIETNGIIDIGKITAFIKNAKGVVL